MNIIALDDEPLLLETLLRSIREAEPSADVRGFSLASVALKKIFESKFYPDVAFLDIEMPGMTGLELAVRIKELSPHTNIVFVTGYSEYAVEAMQLYPSGYVIKQVTAEKIRCELDNLRYPVKRICNKKLHIQCFGNFEAFVDGTSINFKSRKAKELFALLIDRRGAAISTPAIASVLWEEEEYSSYLKNRVQQTITHLRSTLKAVGCEDVLIKGYNSTALDIEKLYCDYYEFLKGDVTSINAFMGEYMAQYSWGEITLAYLYRKV